ncbi:MAG: aminoacyl-tRNA hydrolase [Alphaproteobacteria bacterium]
MLLFVGLGNPGADYARNRHNIGFMAVDAIAQRHGFGPWRRRFQSEVAEGALDGEKVIAVKPQTYMNHSGRAVGEALRFFKLAPNAAFVFYDELDLAPGKIRVKLGGGRGSHNGIRDITDHIGADFWRVRIGIGHPGHKDAVIGHVLKDFAKSDRGWLETLLDSVAAAAPLLVTGDPNGFMNKVAVALQPPREPKQPPGPKAQPAGAPGPSSSPPPLAGDTAAAPEAPKGALGAALARVFGRGGAD